MTKAKIWRLKGGRYGGITARGKRFIEKSREAALRRIGRSSRRGKTKSKRVSAKKGGMRRVARRRRRGKSLVQTAYKLIPAFALAAPGAAYLISGMGPRDKLVNITRVYTGYHLDNKRFNLRNLAEGWMPFLGTSLAVWGIRKLRGIIRRL